MSTTNDNFKLTILMNVSVPRRSLSEKKRNNLMNAHGFVYLWFLWYSFLGGHWATRSAKCLEKGVGTAEKLPTGTHGFVSTCLTQLTKCTYLTDV